jgi:hypothetical protein
MSTDGVPLGSIYLQTGTASTSDYAGTAGVATFATSSGQSGTALKATSAGNAGTALYATSSGNAGTALYASSSGNAGTSLKATSAGDAGTAMIAGTANYATSSGATGTALFATSAGNAGTAFKATSAGYCGTAQVFAAPFASLSCGSSMTAAATTAAYTIFYTHNDVISGITHTTAGTAGAPDYAGRVYFPTAGTYFISFSAIAKSSAVNETLEIWMAVDGVNIGRSNTRSTFVGNNNERLITVTYIYTFTANQYFELLYRVSNVAVAFVATGTAATPDRPASPSIITTISRIA